MSDSKVKKHKNYKKPPIVEAVIELRFAESLNQQHLETLALKKKSRFTVQKIEEIEFKISAQKDLAAQTEINSKLVGYKLIGSDDTSNLIQIKSNSISISRLPPYEGWPKLIESFKEYYSWYTNKKFKPLNRIGVRYINRIDIPMTTKGIELEDYFKVYPATPKTGFLDINSFGMQTVAALDNSKVLTINLHSANETPLINHASIVFDLDVAQVQNMPLSEAKLFETLEQIRVIKDQHFENLLTPRCKKIFN